MKELFHYIDQVEEYLKKARRQNEGENTLSPGCTFFTFK
jgi:hypothetical protein